MLGVRNVSGRCLMGVCNDKKYFQHSVQLRTGQVRAHPVIEVEIRAGDVRAGQVRTGQVRTGQVKSGQVKSN